MIRKIIYIVYGKSTRAKKHVLIGFGIGFIIGLSLSFLATSRSEDWFNKTIMYLFSFNMAFPALGGAIGYIIAKRIERMEKRQYMRRRYNLCLNCDYNLTGNVTGICPECGEKI